MYMTLRQSAKTCGITISDGKLHIQGGNSLASKYNQGLLVRRHQHHPMILQRKWNLLQEITVIWPDLYAITIMTIITI